MLVVLEVIAGIAGFTALLDMGMNGGKDAGWAPWGFGIFFLCVIPMYLMGFK